MKTQAVVFPEANKFEMTRLELEERGKEVNDFQVGDVVYGSANRLKNGIRVTKDRSELMSDKEMRIIEI